MRKLAFIVLAVLAAIALARHVLVLSLALTGAGALVVLALWWAFWPHRRLPRNRSRHLRLRLRLRLNPGAGHATLAELHLRWGRLASFRESRRARPSLGRWQRLAHPSSHSFVIGRAQHRHVLRVPVQEHGSLAGPPRSGKTAVMSRVAMDAPGALLTSSSKPDVFNLTSGHRSDRGPVWVFNPQGIGGIPSNVRWSPLDGCLEPAVAIRRADAFSSAVSTAGTEDGTFWSGKASDGLRGLFAAAALIASDMRRVGRWVGADSEVAEAVAILEAASRTDWAAKLAELTGAAERTSATVRMVMSRALGFLDDPALAAATLPGPGQGFDIDEFLLSGGSLYMIARGNGDDAALAPLFAALASEVHHRAIQLASRMPGGRLDPPLTMVLDELTQICPVPLPGWLADSGGQGISIWTAFHGVSQLRSRWKDAGAQTVLDTTNCRIFLPGLADTETLDKASKLCGQASYRERGEDRHTLHDVMRPDMIRQLPAGHALIIRNGHAPVIARLARGWEHRPYKRLRRRGLDVASITPLPAAPAAELLPVDGAALALAAAPRLAGPAPATASNGHNSNGHSSHPWGHDEH